MQPFLLLLATGVLAADRLTDGRSLDKVLESLNGLDLTSEQGIRDLILLGQYADINDKYSDYGDRATNDDTNEDTDVHDPQYIPWPAFSSIATENTSDWGDQWKPWNRPGSRLPPPWGTGSCDMKLCKCTTKACHDQSFIIEGLPPRLWEVDLNYGIKNLLRDYKNHHEVKNFAMASMGWSDTNQRLFGIKLGRYFSVSNGLLEERERSQVFAIGGNSYDVGLVDYDVDTYQPSPDMDWNNQVPCPPGKAGTVDNRFDTLINIRQCRTYHETFNPQPTTRILAIDIAPCSGSTCEDQYQATEVPVTFDDSWSNKMTRLHEINHADYGPWRPVDWCLDPFTGVSYANQHDAFMDFTDIIPYPDDDKYGDNVAPDGESWFFATFMLKDEWATSKQSSMTDSRPYGPWLDPRIHTYRSCFDTPIRKSDVLKAEKTGTSMYPPGYDPADGATRITERKNYPLFNVRIIVNYDTTSRRPVLATISRIKVPNPAAGNGRSKMATQAPNEYSFDDSISNLFFEDSIISIWSGFGTTTGNNVRPDYGFRYDHGPGATNPVVKSFGEGMSSVRMDADRDPHQHFGWATDYEEYSAPDDVYWFEDGGSDPRGFQWDCREGREPHCIDAFDYVERTNGYRSTLGNAPTLCALVTLPKSIASPHVTLADDHKPSRTSRVDPAVGLPPDIPESDKMPATWSKWNGIMEHTTGNHPQLAAACVDMRTGRGMRLNFQGGNVTDDRNISHRLTEGDFPPNLEKEMSDSPDPVCDPSSTIGFQCDTTWPYGGAARTWTTPGLNCGAKRSAFYQRAKATPPGFDETAPENQKWKSLARPDLSLGDWHTSATQYYCDFLFRNRELYDGQGYYKPINERARKTHLSTRYVQKNAATIGTPYHKNFSEYRRQETNCHKFDRDGWGWENKPIPELQESWEWSRDCAFMGSDRTDCWSDDPNPIYDGPIIQPPHYTEEVLAEDVSRNQYEYIETCGFANVFTNLGEFHSQGIYSGASCPAQKVDPPTKDPWEEMVCYSDVHADINEFVTPTAGRPHHQMYQRSAAMIHTNQSYDFVEMYNITSHCYPKFIHSWPFSQYTPMPEIQQKSSDLIHNKMDPTQSLWEQIRGTPDEIFAAPNQCIGWKVVPCLGPNETRPPCFHRDKEGVCRQAQRPVEAECYLGNPLDASMGTLSVQEEQKLIDYAHCYYTWFKQLLGDWAVASWIMPQAPHSNWEGRVVDQVNIHMLTWGKPANTPEDPSFLNDDHYDNIPDDFVNVYMPGVHANRQLLEPEGNNFNSITRYSDPKLAFCKFGLDPDIAPNGHLWNEERLYMSIRAGPRLGHVCDGSEIKVDGTGCVPHEIIDDNRRNRHYGYLSAWMWQPLIPVEKYDTMTNRDIKEGFKVWNTRGAGWMPVLDRLKLDQQLTWFELCLPTDVQAYDSGNPWTDSIPRQRNCMPLRSSICSNRARLVEDCALPEFRVPIIRDIPKHSDPYGFHQPMVVFRLAPDDRLLDLNTVIPMGQTFYYNLNVDMNALDHCKNVLGEVRPPWLNH